MVLTLWPLPAAGVGRVLGEGGPWSGAVRCAPWRGWRARHGGGGRVQTLLVAKTGLSGARRDVARRQGLDAGRQHGQLAGEASPDLRRLWAGEISRVNQPPAACSDGIHDDEDDNDSLPCQAASEPPSVTGAARPGPCPLVGLSGECRSRWQSGRSTSASADLDTTTSHTVTLWPDAQVHQKQKITTGQEHKYQPR